MYQLTGSLLTCRDQPLPLRRNSSISPTRTGINKTTCLGVNGSVCAEGAIYEFRYSFPVTVFFCIAYTSVFVIGVTGNVFVVSVVYRSPRMRSPTNLFIANLACADLLVNVICLPFTLVSNVMTAWTMGWLVCKTIPYLQGVSVNASINTLVAISVERCLAICFPMKWQVTSGAVKVAVFIIWTFSLSITLPWALYFQLRPLEEGSRYQKIVHMDESCKWRRDIGDILGFFFRNLLGERLTFQPIVGRGFIVGPETSDNAERLCKVAPAKFRIVSMTVKRDTNKTNGITRALSKLIVGP
ncbi:neuropeptide SIFamide receptor-like [Cimex lectularius]|uniref:G-protein coupled receptors family 1 profile domain-containing protein n=1 Tax=Cimex lectularius TaxID=79782 RepID=A0A8I6TII5_CIMLE|nr:neuropeptide SIFamide receptor-like [Cimex lectularius]